MNGAERMTKRLSVGVVGCGLIACVRDYGMADACADGRELIAAELDAVLVLARGSHAPIAAAATDSPFLRSMPTLMTIEASEPNTPRYLPTAI